MVVTERVVAGLGIEPEASMAQPREGALAYAPGDGAEVADRGLGQSMKAHGALVLDEDPVGEERVEARVEIGAGAPEPLHEADAAGVSVGDMRETELALRSMSHEPRDRMHERRDDVGANLGVVRHEVTQRHGHGEHVLTIRRFWQNGVDQVSGGLCHPSSGA